MIVFDESSEFTSKEKKIINRIFNRAYKKRYGSITFWRLIGCKLLGHKKNFHKTRRLVIPGLFCGRCFRWIVK